MVKSHHNVGSLPEDLQFRLVEPLKQLFKDKCVLAAWNWDCLMIWYNRQPFPGPGLGVRCLGIHHQRRLEAVRESDAILRKNLLKPVWIKEVWQYFTISAKLQIGWYEKIMKDALSTPLSSAPLTQWTL